MDTDKQGMIYYVNQNTYTYLSVYTLNLMKFLIDLDKSSGEYGQDLTSLFYITTATKAFRNMYYIKITVIT